MVLRIADDLADLGLATDALDEYRDVLRRATDRDELKRAWYGVARCELTSGRLEEAIDAYRELGARYPEEAKTVDFQMLRCYTERWRWNECLDLLRSLSARDDLREPERAEVTALAAWIGGELDDQPVVGERLEGRLGPGWLLTNPLRATLSPRRGIEVEVGSPPLLVADSAVPVTPGRRGASFEDLAGAGPAALLLPVPWQGEACTFSFELKVLSLAPGAAVRIGLCGGPPQRQRTGDRLLVELYGPDDPGIEGTGVAPMARLIGVAGDARVERALASREPRLSLDVPYRFRVEYVPALGRARLTVSEREGLEAPRERPSPGGSSPDAKRPEGDGALRAKPRSALETEISLPHPFAAETYFFGLLAPADEPEGTPARVAIEALDLSCSAAAAARPVPPPSGLEPAEEALMRGNVALACGSPSDALARYREALALDPLLDGAVFGAGVAAAQAGDLSASARSFASLVRTDPRAREAFRRVADELASRGPPALVLDALETFVAIDPADAARRAALEAARGKVAASLDTEVEREGGFTLLDRERRARLYLRVGEPDRALSEVERATEAVMKGGDGSAPADLIRLRADCLYAKRDVGGAWLDYTRAGSRDPQDPDALIGIAMILIERGQTTRGAGTEERPEAAADAALTRAARLAPERAEVLRLRARARFALERLDDARADVERSLALEARSADGASIAAEIALRQGRIAEARALLERAARFGPVDPALAARVAAGGR